MDTAVRLMLSKAENEGHEDHLLEAFEKLKRGRKVASDQTDPFSSDLYVVCAEVALKLEKRELVEDCMKLYFQKTPPNNQFLCRAYLCQAQFHAPTSSKDRDKLERSTSYLLKAISFAKQNKRYHFLVYNASVLYWSFARPFLKPNFRHVLARSFHIVVKALDDTNDADYEWRAHLMIAVMECHIDAGRRDDAAHVGQAAMQFTKSYVSHMRKEVFALQVQYKIIDPVKLTNIMKSSVELTIYNKILKLKGQHDSISSSNASIELEKLFHMIVDGDDGSGSRSANSSRPPGPLLTAEKNSLLLDLIRLSLEMVQPEVAEKSIVELLESTSDTMWILEIDILKCDLMVKKLKEKSESYIKANIDIRLQAVNLLEEHLMSAFRLQDENLIQIGCNVLWNLSLPLLQNNLRHKVRKQLLLAVEMLENIDSLLSLLRCQMHLEVAKCEEEQDQLQSAIMHILKAMELDDTGSYQIRLENSLKRLKLRALLYQVPQRPEDHAAMIIEQAESSADASTSSKMRNYLSKAGCLLAPDAFNLAMDGEEALISAKRSNSSVEKLADKVKRYQKGISKIAGHLERLGNVDSEERVRLWADLAKTARKQKVWDVTRIAAMFCLLYDDNRWSTKALIVDSPVKSVDSKHNVPALNSVEFGILSKEQLQGLKTFTMNDDLLRLLAEVNFIYAEALVQLLQTEGLQLLENAKAPEDNKLRPKKYENNTVKLSETTEWITYSEWINETSKKAISSFQRAANLGVDLNESWIVCNAGIYVWNYTNHLLCTGKYSALTEHLQPLFDGLQTVGHGTETIFLCDLTHAVAQGYLQRYIPASYYKPIAKIPEGRAETSNKDRKSRLGHASNQNINTKPKPSSLALPPNALTELRQAADILEYTLNVTNGVDKENIVPIAVRNHLIKAWILCKGLMNQALPRNYGHDNDAIDSQGPMSKALCALEALSLQTKKVVDFSPCPNINEVIKLIELAKWTDKQLLLQVWSQLAVVSFNNNDIETSIRCCDTALNLGNEAKKKNKKKTSNSEHNFAVEQEMLYYASIVRGECLVSTMNGMMKVRRQALDCFVDACKYASKAQNYDLVMAASRRYWNTVHQLISRPIERQLLIQPVKMILKYIANVAKNVIQEKDEEKNKMKGDMPTPPSSKDSKERSSVVSIIKGDIISPIENKSNVDEDIMLRASLYSVLFQAYADKGELEEGLVAMDEAIKVMPRTHHRLLIFKHRVITQAKLSKPVQFDMAKFRDENEALLSEMWLRVAKHSVNQNDQISAYVNAIEVLTEEENIYQKVDCLAEYSEWLFVNEFPVQKALDQLAYAISLLINGMKGHKAKLEFSTNFISFKDDLKFLQEIKDIQQMDVLVRLYVMISEMTGHKSEMYRQFTLAAAFLVQHMWKVSLSNAEKCIKDGIKPGDISPTKSLKDKKSSKDFGRPEKPSKVTMPVTLESWATYQLSDKYKEYFNEDKHNLYISTSAIKKPMLSLYYLEKLTENLHNIGFNHLSIHVMLLMTYIAEDLVGNESLLLLMHMRCCELYQVLNMNTAYEHFQTFLQEPVLIEDDQEKSREEIEVWQEKQRQVKLEEKRRGSNLKLVTSYQQLASYGRRKKPEIGKVILREVWAKMAEYLIKNGQYQNARLLLEEASLSAHAFDDSSTQELINYNLALIAFHETDWGKAISLLEDSESLPNTQMFWLKKILLLVDSLHSFSQQESTFQSHLSDEGFENSKNVLENALKTISDLSDSKNNCTHLGPYIKARLLSKLAVILYTESKEKRYKSLSHTRGLLQKACSYLEESFKKLSELGHKSESIEMMFLLVEIQKKLSLAQEETLMKKKLLLETLNMSRMAVKNVTLVAAEITDLSPREEVGNIFLPIQHDIITARVHCIDVMYEIIKLSLDEKKAERLHEERKEFIVRLIDNYVDVKPELSSFDKTWANIISSITEEAMMLSSSIQMLCNKEPRLHAKTSLHLGILLAVLAKYNNSDHFEAWSHVTKQEPDEVETDSKQFESSETQLYELQIYKYFLSQAVDNLLQTVHISLQYQYTSVLQHATHELLDCIGVRDHHLAVQLLALNQSTQTSMVIEKIFRRALIDPHTSENAALLAQNRLLRQTTLNKSYNMPLQMNITALKNYESSRYVTISKNHFEIVKDIPFNITYIILQHSYDKKYIYGGLMEKSQAGTAGKKKEASSAPRTMICRQSTSSELLGKLLELCSEFKSMIGSELMRQVYSHYQKERRKELLGTNNDTEEAIMEEMEINEDEASKIHEAFITLVTATEAYFGDVLSKIETSLNQQPSPETIVILADESLLELPLEALNIFTKQEIKSVSRDFSLQMFYHRLKQGDNDGRQSKLDQKTASNKGKLDAKSGKNSAQKGGKTNAQGDKKNGFVMDKDNILLDLTNLKYIVDPLNDGGNDPNHPDNIIDSIINTHKQKISKWSGIKGSHEVSNVKDMQSLLHTSQGFLFFGYERLLAFIPPSCVAALNLNECHFALLLDLVETSSSYLRQGNLDAIKSPNDLLLENPVHTSMLLSLCGINTISLNQWNTTLDQNKEKLNAIMNGLFESNLNIGQSIRSIGFPPPPIPDGSEKLNHSKGGISNIISKKKLSTTDKSDRSESVSENELPSETCDNSSVYEKFNMIVYGLPNFVTTL